MIHSRYFVIYLVVLVVLGTCGCSRIGNPKEPSAMEDPGRKNGETPPQEPSVPVAIARVTIGDIGSYYRAMATLAAEKDTRVLARVSGVVESIQCEEGDRVEQGQTLLRIENEEYRFRLAQAEATRADLRSRFDRVSVLQQQKLVSQQEFEGIENSLKAALAEEELARLSLSYTAVMAPFRGIITSRDVNIGQTVSVGTQLFVLADFQPLLARVHVPAREFRKLSLSQPVELVLESNKIAMQGRISLISPVIDPSSGTIKVTIGIDDYPEGVRPGDFAEVRIVTDLRHDSLLIPSLAVVTQEEEKNVFVAVEGHAESRPVETGYEDGNTIEILAGLAVDDLVIVKGQRLLKTGSPIKIMESDGREVIEEASPKSDQVN